MKTAKVDFRKHKSQRSASEVPDVNLLYACGEGELEALGLLFERHRDSVYRFLSRLSGMNTQDLDDLVEMTFLQVQRSIPTFRARASVRNWILGIAANVARHHIRGEVRRKNLVMAYSDIPRQPEASPQDSAVHGETFRRLADAVENLPYKQRVVFVLCCLEGVAGSEVAKILGLRQGTVRRRLHEARKRLVKALEWSEE